MFDRPGRYSCAALVPVLVGLLLVAACGGGAPTGEPPATAEAEPPLLDRDLFFGDPEIASARLSADGRFVSFRKPYREVMNLWVKEADAPFEDARPITADTERPVNAYFWSQDGRWVLYVQDKAGDENYHLYAVDPAAPAEEESGVPPARDLTPIEGVRAQFYRAPENTPGQVVIGLNDRDPAVHDVYRVDLESGERELVLRNETGVATWVIDLDGRVRLAYRVTDDGGTEVVRVEDGALGGLAWSCDFGETCDPLRFHRDGRRVYAESNVGDDVDLTRLVLHDLESGEVEVVDSDPLGEVDLGGPIFSDATEELVATVYYGDRQRYHVLDEDFGAMLEDVRGKLPDGDLDFTSSTEDGSQWLVRVSRDVDPGSVYHYDRAGGEVEKLYSSAPDLPSEHLAPMKAVRYEARDGLTVHGYLVLPKGKGEEDLPVVVLPHGGPWSRSTWGFDAIAQFLANRGYAVLDPNFRGSTGYGKAFLNAGNAEWGDAMQHDLTDGVRWLVDAGIADPERVGIMGGSYGGYATLAGVAFTPDLYAAGVSVVGPSNLVTLLRSIPPYWGPIRAMFYRRMGDPDDPADRERLERQSPLLSARKITAPLLVIQGANDPRVPQAESDQIVAALHELGREVEYLVAPDEGHGFRGEENRLALFAASEKFLAEHLGGRYQEDVPPEVAETLETMRVAPASVAMEGESEGQGEG